MGDRCQTPLSFGEPLGGVSLALRPLRVAEAEERPGERQPRPGAAGVDVHRLLEQPGAPCHIPFLEGHLAEFGERRGGLLLRDVGREGVEVELPRGGQVTGAEEAIGQADDGPRIVGALLEAGTELAPGVVELRRVEFQAGDADPRLVVAGIHRQRLGKPFEGHHRAFVAFLDHSHPKRRERIAGLPARPEVEALTGIVHPERSDEALGQALIAILGEGVVSPFGQECTDPLLHDADIPALGPCQHPLPVDLLAAPPQRRGRLEAALGLGKPALAAEDAAKEKLPLGGRCPGPRRGRLRPCRQAGAEERLGFGPVVVGDRAADRRQRCRFSEPRPPPGSHGEEKSEQAEEETAALQP